MIAGTTLANRAGQYLVASSVNAIAEQIKREIGSNLTFENIGRVVGGLLPGKRNKAKRKAVVRKLQNGRNGGGMQNMRTAPVAINVPNRFRVKPGTNNFRVKNREFVGEISGATNYTLTHVISVQPGVNRSFPWLSQIATNHQKYKFHKLTFTFVPSCGTDTRGRIAMAYAIDPLDDFPVDQQTLYQYPEQTDSSLWSSMSYTVPSAHLKQLFTRSQVVDGTDIKTYDNGVLFVATYGAADNSVAGSLFVDYEVELINPAPKAISDQRLYSIEPVLSADRWFSQDVVIPPGAPFQLIANAESTGFRFLQTGWFCLRMDIIASTTAEVTALLPTVGTQAGAAEIKFGPDDGTFNIIQDGIRQHVELWINVRRTIAPMTRHVYFKLGDDGLAGIAGIQLGVNKMENATQTTL